MWTRSLDTVKSCKYSCWHRFIFPHLHLWSTNTVFKGLCICKSDLKFFFFFYFQELFFNHFLDAIQSQNWGVRCCSYCLGVRWLADCLLPIAYCPESHWFLEMNHVVFVSVDKGGILYLFCKLLVANILNDRDWNKKKR